MIPQSSDILCIVDFETIGPDFATSEFLDSYPIEIACLFVEFTDLKLITAFHSLICWPFMNRLKEWPQKFQAAYEVNQISIDQVRASGKLPVEVALSLIQACERFSDRRLVLTSDNITFEHFFMKKLLRIATTKWPFHYHAYDTSLLFQFFETTKTPKKHRAMSDVHWLRERLREVYKRLALMGPNS